MSRERDDFNDAPILAEIGALLRRRAALLDSSATIHGPGRDPRGGHRAGRRWAAGRVLGSLPIVLSVAVAGVVAALAVITLGHGHQSPRAASRPPAPVTSTPVLLPPVDPAVQPYVTSAAVYVTKHDAGCSGTARSRAPRLSEGSPSKELLSAFAIFRRPAVATDRPPRGYGNGIANPDVRGVFVRFVRRAQYRYGGGFYLTPAADVLAGHQPRRCDTAQTAALQKELPQIPARLRARAERLQAREIARDRYLQEHPEGICVVQLNNQGFGGGGCGATLAQQEQHPGLGGSNGDINYGLVRDGISSITYRYPATRSARAFTITVPVINNLVVYKAPLKLSANPTLILRATDGRVIRTIHGREASG